MTRFLFFSEVRCCFCFDSAFSSEFPVRLCLALFCSKCIIIIIFHRIFIIAEFVFFLYYFPLHLAITGCETVVRFFTFFSFLFFVVVHKDFDTDIALFSSPSRYQSQGKRGIKNEQPK